MFAAQLADLQPRRATRRRWLFVPYDQLTAELGPLAREDPDALGVVLIEAPAKARRRPYHRQKLALVLTNLRHFALEQAARGVAVRHVVADGGYAPALAALRGELGPLRMMTPAERELRVELAPLVADGTLEELPHEGWLTTPAQFAAWCGDAPWRMDAFYRGARRATGVLMDDGQPRGGKFSFDTENRLPWKGTPPAPAPPRYPVDEITAEVCALIERTFPDHPGELTPAALPASADDAAAAWRWALRHALPRFGPYEDAMSTRSSTLFHTQLAGLLNLHRLVPARVVADAAAAALPLASQEGFVRQILGWREFVRHVHLATDGFRTIAPVAAAPGDGGWSRWRGRAWPATAEAARELGGATPAALGAGRPLPVAYWGAPSGLACLDHVVADVWRTGYGHHITRLMILANLGALLDVAPRELTDWFWVAYADAYDWVVEPNVLGMGMFATGDLMTTKPYVAGAAYVDRMSDYCAGCRFDPKRSCPVTRLYWAFLDRHEAALGGNHRLTMPLAQLRKRAPAERARDRAVFDEVRAHLDGGLAVPADVVTRPR